MTIFTIFDNEPGPYSYLAGSLSVSGLPVEDADVSADQYLSFAASDLIAETAQGDINALGNAKRALHLTVDGLLSSYGLLAHNRRISFPRKLELLADAGLFTLSILRTLNLERNVMEHEYKVPPRPRVLETIDVAHLLLLATQRMRELVVCELLAGWKEGDKHGLVRLDPREGNLAFFEVAGPTHPIEVGDSAVEVLDPVRGVRAEIKEGVIVSTDPIWSVELSHRNSSEWAPLLRPVIAQQDWAVRDQGTVVSPDGESFAVSIRVLLPGRFGEAFYDALEMARQTMADQSHGDVGGEGPNEAATVP